MFKLCETRERKEFHDAGEIEAHVMALMANFLEIKKGQCMSTIL